MEGSHVDENAFGVQSASEASHAVIGIKIKTLDSQVYTCQVARNVSVPDLKEQLASLTGVPTESQRLICRGKVLKDEHNLSVYEVEEGHTLHLVTRPAPPSVGIQNEDEDQHTSASRNRAGVSHSVLVGTFNSPDHIGTAFPEINRIFSSLLSSLRIGNVFPAAARIGSGDGHGTAVNAYNGSQEIPMDRDLVDGAGGQEVTDHESTGPAQITDRSFPGLRAGVGFVGAIPAALPQIRIVQQVVPDGLRVLSRHVHRIEQALAASSRLPTSLVSFLDSYANLESQSISDLQDQQPSPAVDDADPTAWASMIRRVQELLSTRASSELMRLADQLGSETNLNTPAAQQSIMSVEFVVQELGSSLLELGHAISRLRTADSVLNTGGQAHPSALLPSMSQPGGGLDTLTGTPMGSENNDRSQRIHIRTNTDNLRTMPFTVSSEVSQLQDGSLTAGNRREEVGSQNDIPQAHNRNVNEDLTSLLHQVSGSVQGHTLLSEHGSIRVLPARTLVAAVPAAFRPRPFSEGAGTGLGLLNPLLARFHPSELSSQQSAEGMVQDQQHESQLSTEQAISSRSGASREHEQATASVLQETCSGMGFDTGNRLRSTDGASIDNNCPNMTVSQNSPLEDFIGPLLHGRECSETGCGSSDLHKSDQNVDNETQLELKCSGDTGKGTMYTTSESTVSFKDDTGISTIHMRALPTDGVSMELSCDGTPSSSSRKRAMDHDDEQVPRKMHCLRQEEPVEDCPYRKDEENVTSVGGTVLKDFLSTLACQRDEESNANLDPEHFPQDLSLVLENTSDCSIAESSLHVKRAHCLGGLAPSEELKRLDSKHCILQNLNGLKADIGRSLHHDQSTNDQSMDYSAFSSTDIGMATQIQDSSVCVDSSRCQEHLSSGIRLARLTTHQTSEDAII